jgi:hypothetical protein
MRRFLRIILVGIVAFVPVTGRAQTPIAIVGAGTSEAGDFLAVAWLNPGAPGSFGLDLSNGFADLTDAAITAYDGVVSGSLLIKLTCVEFEARGGGGVVVHASGIGNPDLRDAFLIKLVAGIGDPNSRDGFRVELLSRNEIPEEFQDPEQRCGAESVEVSPLRAGAFVSIGFPDI